MSLGTQEPPEATTRRAPPAGNHCKGLGTRSQLTNMRPTRKSFVTGLVTTINKSCQFCWILSHKIGQRHCAPNKQGRMLTALLLQSRAIKQHVLLIVHRVRPTALAQPLLPANHPRPKAPLLHCQPMRASAQLCQVLALPPSANSLQIYCWGVVNPVQRCSHTQVLLHFSGRALPHRLEVFALQVLDNSADIHSAGSIEVTGQSKRVEERCHLPSPRLVGGVGAGERSQRSAL